MICLLCHTPSKIFSKEVFECSHCKLVFKNPVNYYNSEQDIKRYTTHNNSQHDQGYVDYLNRLVLPLQKFLPENFETLDFGCGPGPTLSLLMEKIGGLTNNYDPIFFPSPKNLEKTYDVVTSSEVVEHFKNLEDDWTLLVSLVKPKGVLAIMTLILSNDVDYETWWYKNDPTHVAFYREETFAYLAQRFEMDLIFNDKKSVMIFRKK